MSAALVIVLIAVIAVFVVAKPKKKNANAGIAQIGESSLYAKRPLSDPEQTLYWNLLSAFPDKLVLPQVSFSRFLYTKGESKKANFSKFAKVRQKVADYVLCDKAFNVLGVIELDDRSHEQERDNQRDEYLKEAGIRVYRFSVRSIPGAEELQKLLT